MNIKNKIMMAVLGVSMLATTPAANAMSDLAKYGKATLIIIGGLGQFARFVIELNKLDIQLDTSTIAPFELKEYPTMKDKTKAAEKIANVQGSVGSVFLSTEKSLRILQEGTISSLQKGFEAAEIDFDVDNEDIKALTVNLEKIGFSLKYLKPLIVNNIVPEIQGIGKRDELQSKLDTLTETLAQKQSQVVDLEAKNAKALADAKDKAAADAKIKADKEAKAKLEVKPADRKKALADLNKLGVVVNDKTSSADIKIKAQAKIKDVQAKRAAEKVVAKQKPYTDQIKQIMDAYFILDPSAKPKTQPAPPGGATANPPAR
jgi:hypothetical protein